VQTLRLHRRGFSWIAFVALLALTFGPTLSRGLAVARDGSAWVEVCTWQSSKSATDRAKGERPVSVHLDHCALCGLAGQAVLPSSVAAMSAPIHPRVVQRPAALQAAPPMVWPLPPSRAPPTLHA
jgi:hypothetical protein